jgi:aminopeptidase N
MRVNFVLLIFNDGYNKMIMLKKIYIFFLGVLSFTVYAQTVDVKHLKLQLGFDWEKRQAMGKAEITLSTLAESNTIYLDAALLEIQSIYLNNQPLTYHYQGGENPNNLEIILDRNYQPQETMVITVHYNTLYENKADPNAIWGSFGKGLRFQEPTSTTPTKRKQIWSSGEPENNKYWFPCNEDLADLHTTEMIVTVEKPLMVITNGNLVETLENTDHTRTFHYNTTQPFPNYLVSLVVGEYVDVTQHLNGVQIHNFGYPDETASVKATTELLPEMMKFLEEKTGYAYPYDQYSQVVVQDYPFPGLNGQHTVSTLSDNYMDDEGVHQDFKYLWDGVAVQALANQWFGNLIMPKSWDDIWLNNAFTQYFADLFTAAYNTKTEYLTYVLPFEKGNVIGDWEAGYQHPVVTANHPDLAGFTSDNYSKYRGALVLHMLQKQVGEKNWWQAIQLYVKTNAHQQVSTVDFQLAIEQITGQSYQWFFDQWIYKIGLPEFEVNEQYNPNNQTCTISVHQIQNQENTTEFKKVDFFQGLLEIEINDTVIPVYIQPQAENLFVFPMSQAPPFVHFNFEETWICKIEFKKSNETYFHQLALSKDVIAQQQALDHLAAMASDTTLEVTVQQRITEAITSEITSNSYWRYRLYALGTLRKTLSLPYNNHTLTLLVQLITTEKSWLKTSAIFTLGNTKDSTYAPLYIEALNDKSDRVINAAAIALGKTKSSAAFPVLVNLANRPSWKSQSRISALNGLEQLGDPRALDFVLNCLADNQSPRWYLATPVWDYPFTAVQTLVSLGKTKQGFPLLFSRFKKSCTENDLNDIFQNVQLIDLLKDKRAKKMYRLLKTKFKKDAAILDVVKNYETRYIESLKN